MNPFLAKVLIYPVYQLVTGRRVLSKLRELERSQWLPPSDIAELQKRRLRDLLVHAHQNVPFYRQRMRSLDCLPEELVNPKSFRCLPILTKDDILSHRDELIATNFSGSALKLNATGGSTGHTLSFYNSQAALDWRSAVTIRGDRWAGLDIGIPHARLWGAPLDIKAQERLANRLHNRALDRLWLDCFRLSDEILADYVQRLRRFRPKVLVGYATALATLAQFVEAQDIHDIQLQSIISSAETLFDEQRQQIENAFDCQVYDRYGCREAGPLIVECEEGCMHVNADYALVEILRDGRPAQPGEIGEVVITPLCDYGMPLIRYQVGDLGVAVAQTSCKCGRGLPTVERIIGRTSDMLVNQRGEIFHGEYFTHLFYHHSGVKQFQVIQPNRNQLIFKVVTTPSFKPDLLHELGKKIRDFVGPMEIQWEHVDEIPTLKSGKRSFTVSQVPLNFNVSIKAGSEGTDYDQDS